MKGGAWRAGPGAAGVVTLGVAGLRRAPDHASELLSQALLGEGFRVVELTPAEDWLRVRLDADGYEGWMRAWGAVPAGGEAKAGPEVGTEARVAAREALILAAPQHSAPVLVAAPWQARVHATDAGQRWSEVALADGRRGFARRSALAHGAAPGGPPTPARLVRTARRLVGTPYLWGGRSAWGFDCSGFVQAVFAWHGVRLPRDAKDQFLAATAGEAGPGVWGPGEARPRSARKPRAGDLLFFGSTSGAVGHVALALGAGEFLHAYGQVTAGSLDQGSQYYVLQLDRQYLGAWPWPRGRAST
jgi:gamma-D-glutamyl-L-lysine dipeptidyl-peptidase